MVRQRHRRIAGVVPDALHSASDGEFGEVVDEHDPLARMKSVAIDVR